MPTVDPRRFLCLFLISAPIISRVKQFIGDGMANYNMARKVMAIPFPFPHAQLSSLFVNLMVILIPLLMEQYTEDRSIGASLTFASVLCLSGVHEVARELENPFRNVPNEVSLPCDNAINDLCDLCISLFTKL